MAVPGYRRVSGPGRRYESLTTGERISYDKYLSLSRDGMSSHQYQAFRQDGRNLALMAAYKEQHDGKLAGMQLSIRDIGLARTRRDKRLALGVFYPEALDAPDERYPVRGAA